MSKFINALIATSLLCFSVPGFANPVLAAGSVYQVNDVANVLGNGFSAGESVTIRIISPSGEFRDVHVNADAKGTINVSIVLNDTGRYFAMLVGENDEGTASISMTVM